MNNAGVVRTLIAVAAVSLALPAHAVPSRKITLTVKLPGKPAFTPPEIGALVSAGPLALEVKDARTVGDPAIVGVQREKGTDISLWRSSDPVVPAVSKMVADILGGWQVRVSEDAKLHFTLELASFYVTEKSETFGSTYVGEVRFKATLFDHAAAVLWSGEAAGTSKQPGVDGKAAEANQALSIALRAALANLMSSVKLESVPPPAAAAPHAEITMQPAVAGALEPDAMFTALSRLKAAGVTDDALLAYVQEHRLARPLTVDEILRWRDAGIPDAVIKAAK